LSSTLPTRRVIEVAEFLKKTSGRFIICGMGSQRNTVPAAKERHGVSLQELRPAEGSVSVRFTSALGPPLIRPCYLVSAVTRHVTEA